MVSRKYLILLSTIGLVVSVDQLTKNTIVSRLHFGESIQVFQSYFNLTRVHNFGAAFGLLSSLPPGSRELFFLVVPIITLLIILFVFYRLREQQGSNVYALSMIMGGALGNLADRIRLGYVIDFFDFHVVIYMRNTFPESCSVSRHSRFQCFAQCNNGFTLIVFQKHFKVVFIFNF